MKVSIVGATGVLGRNVVPRLLERGHEVTAVVRKPEQVRGLQRVGVQAIAGDVLVPSSLAPAMRGCDCVLHLATAIPKDRAGGDWSVNDRIRREGTENLLRVSAENGVRRYIQQSITMLYGDCGQDIVDELAPPHPSPNIQSAFDMEEQVRASEFEWCILRGGYFYGPSTGMEDGWRDAARRGTLRIPANSNARISLIHIVDMAYSVVLSAEIAPPRSVYNVVDDHPATYAELYAYVARQVQAPDPERSTAGMLSLGCSNLKIKAELGWRAAFPTFRSGLA
jgi:nucleoside-diphosphate-sugar epimerase